MKFLKYLQYLVAATLIAGCTYNGKLDSGFYMPPVTANKIPLKVNLICGDFFKSIVIDPGHIYGAYSVHLQTDPALQSAIQSACEKVFDKVSVSSVADAQNHLGADIVIFPKIEMVENHLTLTLTIKRSDLNETIEQYSASDNCKVNAPAGVHVLDTLDIFACGALAPIIIPSNTAMIGHHGKSIIQKRLSYCLGQIVENIENDPALVAKAKSKKIQSN